MLILSRAKHMEICGAVESDEVYVTSGLKGRNNSERIRRIGRKPRRRDLKSMDHGGRISQQSSYSLGGVMWRIIFHQGMLSLKPKIIGRHVLELNNTHRLLQILPQPG
jgi:hypothetical protein